MNYQLSLHKGSLELEQEVLKKELCTACGACLGLCPYLRVRKENVVLLEPCGLKEGRCYEVCPRTKLDFSALNQQVFGEERRDYVLGRHQGLYLAQSALKEVQKKAQYGGVVSGLLIYALSKKLIDGAILVGYSSNYQLLPEPILARSKKEILACAGSKYTSAPSLKILNQALKECSKLAFVGRGCQVSALRKRIMVEPEIGEKIALIIGLFCMWALDYRKLYSHLAKKLDLSSAKRFDIPYNRFLVWTDKKRIELEFEPIRALKRPTCDFCYDFTAEFSDLSVGSTEWKDDWNTLIVRSERGKKVIEQAKKAKALCLKPFPEDREKLLRQASLGKKKRVVNGVFLEKKANDYLVLSKEERSWIENQELEMGAKK